MKKFISFLSALLIVSINLPMILACGPSTTDPFFELTKHPDYPLSNFAGGKIGILKPSFARSYLFAAYKQLNNGKFSSLEQKNLNEYWVYKIEGDYAENNNKPVISLEKSIDDWFATRKKVVSEKPADLTNDVDSKNENYSSYKNCLGDSFANAAKTLDNRIVQYGAASTDIKYWVEGQDAVFGNCAGTMVNMPTIPLDAPKWLQKDRAYQTAAGLFYAGNMTSARDEFSKIAADKDSEWQKTAEFVVARTYIRQAGLTADENEIKTAREQAIEQLQKILAEPEMKEFHLSAERLLNYVKDRLAPDARLKELPEKLLSNSENPNLQWEMNDYTTLLDTIKAAHDENVQKVAEDPANKESYDYYQKVYFKFLPAKAHTDDLTDWIFTFQGEGTESYDYAVQKWKGNHQIQWLVAALSKAGKDSPNAADLINDADKITSDSPAYTNAAYHEIRILIQQNKRAEAKKKLLEVFNADFKNFPVSTQNQFLEQRAVVAENLEEYLKFAARHATQFVDSYDANEAPASFTDEEGKPYEGKINQWKDRLMFDADAVKFFNLKAPLSVLRQAALNQELPVYLHKPLVIAVWTRAFALENTSVEREFAPLVLKFAPEYQALFGKYVNAADATEREAAVLEAVLNYPKFEPYVESGYGREDETDARTIDSLRGNWWCAQYKTNEELYADASETKYADAQIYPNFLTAAQNAEREREQQKLTENAGSSSTYLTKRALNFAQNHPKHPNATEILHLSVRSTRYGCSDANTGKFSKAAFTLLHQNYPNDAFTKKTPFWFQ